MSTIHRDLLDEVKARPSVYPAQRFSGRGIVVCAGGRKYFTCAWVCINMLRKLGCLLPIEVWHMGEREMSPQMKELLAPLKVEFVDALKVHEQYPVRTLNGWELKPYAVIHSRFQEVLLLDADNVAVTNPENLFDAIQYRQAGAVFWPDFGRLSSKREIWNICGVEYRDEPEFESGQMLIDKARCWKALEVTMHLNEYSDYYYRHIHGDKETFHMAWRSLDQPYAMPTKGIRGLSGTMCQHDFEGCVLFQHRNMKKWSLGENSHVVGFKYEDDCLRFLEQLRHKWRATSVCRMTSNEKALYERIARQRRFLYVRVGHDARPMDLLGSLDVGMGQAGMERQWAVRESEGKTHVELHGDGGLTCALELTQDGVLAGRWLSHERMAILLVPIRPGKS